MSRDQGACFLPASTAQLQDADALCKGGRLCVGAVDARRQKGKRSLLKSKILVLKLGFPKCTLPKSQEWLHVFLWDAPVWCALGGNLTLPGEWIKKLSRSPWPGVGSTEGLNVEFVWSCRKGARESLSKHYPFWINMELTVWQGDRHCPAERGVVLSLCRGLCGLAVRAGCPGCSPRKRSVACAQAGADGCKNIQGRKQVL